MNKRSFLLGTTVGIAIGFLAKTFAEQNQHLSPEVALERVKEAFQRTAPVSGSWIYIEPQTYEKNGLVYETYRGGITRTMDDQQNQYEFQADVKTGVVIDVETVN